jgi:hypothetical protein
MMPRDEPAREAVRERCRHDPDRIREMLRSDGAFENWTYQKALERLVKICGCLLDELEARRP